MLHDKNAASVCRIALSSCTPWILMFTSPVGLRMVGRWASHHLALREDISFRPRLLESS